MKRTLLWVGAFLMAATGIALAQGVVVSSGGTGTVTSVSGGTAVTVTNGTTTPSVACNAADGGNPGCVTTAAQQFAGDKQFTGRIGVGAGTPSFPLDVIYGLAADSTGHIHIKDPNNNTIPGVMITDSANNNAVIYGYGNLNTTATTYRSSGLIFTYGTTPLKIVTGNDTSVATATFDSSHIMTMGQASGSNAIAFSTNGARLDLGTGASDYLYSDGTSVNTATTLIVNGNMQVTGQNVQEGTANTPLIIYPRINNGASAVGTKMANQNTLSTAGAQIVGFYNDASVSVEVAAVDKDGSYLHKGNPTLQTCAAGLEGLVSRDGAAGVSTGARTRLCLCTSDGAGTPAYAWQNMASGTVGTATTCSP